MAALALGAVVALVFVRADDELMVGLTVAAIVASMTAAVNPPTKSACGSAEGTAHW